MRISPLHYSHQKLYDLGEHVSCIDFVSAQNISKQIVGKSSFECYVQATNISLSIVTDRTNTRLYYLLILEFFGSDLTAEDAYSFFQLLKS